MRDAETVLAVIRERGRQRLPLEDVYRQLFNPDLFLRAYGRIYPNRGAMTPGSTEETVDGMGREKIDTIIEALRHERWRWTPVRRVQIPKKNGTMRPLGIPTWSDKLLQEVMRSLLEAYYEPQFSDHSHGFRPEKGCHTALDHIQTTWGGSKWFIEGDIKGCFDNIDHQVLLSLLQRSIRDNRFMRLVEGLLRAGYLEQWRYHSTLSGTPQGGILSPLLANIYMDQLDQFVEKTLLPAHNQGKGRVKNPEYRGLSNRREILRRRGRNEEAEAVLRQMQLIPSIDTTDPNYRRLRYVRYADDFLLGYVGRKAEAETIKDTLTTFLKDFLRLELSPEKTLITHAATEKARFLGYDVGVKQCDTQHDRRGHRSINGVLALRVPADFVEGRCKRYMKNGKAIHRAELLEESDYDIVSIYQQEYRGYVEYYGLAQNLSWLAKLHWVMETSLLKTLASKHKSSVNAMAKKYHATRTTFQGPRKCLRVIVERSGKLPLVAEFGGISLTRRKNVTIREPWENQYRQHFADPARIACIPKRVELLTRLCADKCEICKEEGSTEVHHIRRLADLDAKDRTGLPVWAKIMIGRRRKTLVLCVRCHDDLHAGRPLKLVQ